MHKKQSKFIQRRKDRGGSDPVTGKSRSNPSASRIRLSLSPEEYKARTQGIKTGSKTKTGAKSARPVKNIAKSRKVANPFNPPTVIITEAEKRKTETAARIKVEQQEQEKLAAAERKARRQAFLDRVRTRFEEDFLRADEVLADDPDAELITVDEYNDLKTYFVQDWVSRELNQSIDSEQAAALSALAGNIQVIARAGSGKTRTLVARAIFLQKHCRVPPNELLLLAFNQAAAREMKSRLAPALGERLPHVMTFHALAHAIVHPEEDLLFDDASADRMGFSREVQAIIDENVRSAKYGARIRDLMLAHFREDWVGIPDGNSGLSLDDLVAHRRSLQRESLNGDYVKSFGEKVIANALFEQGIDYRYERNFHWGGINYRPDFTITTGPDSGVVIEYFGLAGEPDYDQMSEQKRAFWAKREGWTLIEFSPDDLKSNGIDSFVAGLLRKLEEAGISGKRRTEEQIWALIKRRALDAFSKAMKIFVGRCRKLNLSLDDLQSMVARHRVISAIEELFLDIGISIYRDYAARLATHKKDDFDGLMWRSVSLIRGGHTEFSRDRARENGDLAGLRFVMIDEFQDFSRSFYELVDAIRTTNPQVRFFCVGDDWQAINGFAGSDLRFFTNFEVYFPGASQRHIRTNYRSSRAVVDAGNAIMSGRGPGVIPARRDAGRVRVLRLDEFKPSPVEKALHSGDDITPAVLRLVRAALSRKLTIAILSRLNRVSSWYVNYDRARGGKVDTLEHFQEHIRSFLPEEDCLRVSVSTTHQFKGLEADAVIILDAVERCYPLIHPNWVFQRIFGDSIDSIESEERRLFYVAVTRAKESLALITDASRESPYLDDMRRLTGVKSMSWSSLPPPPSFDGTSFEIRVFDAFDVKDHLKSLKYSWSPSGKYWVKRVSGEDADASASDLRNQPWMQGETRIEVYTESGKLVTRK